MVDKIALIALFIGFALVVVHYFYKHVFIDNPAPELLVALFVLAIPILLIVFGKIKVVDR